MSQTYWGSEIVNNLGIASSAWLKYCFVLEEAEYFFEREQ
ncbi:hypothetical protein IK3_05690 [Bacillus toyonensis]|nr:hypothetical protein IK3_05690 [Bacillus toyonensis]